MPDGNAPQTLKSARTRNPRFVRQKLATFLTNYRNTRTLVRTYWTTTMTTVTATEARKQLYKLLDDVSDSHEPVQITGKRGNAVLVGEDDWRAVQETLYLVSIPGVRESIIEGMATPAEELDRELRW